MKGRRSSDRRVAGLVATTFALTLLVFSPIRVATGNLEEFEIGLPNVFDGEAFAAVLGLAGLLTLLALSTRVRAFLVVLTSLVYLQGVFLVWDYGAFDGEGIDWETNRVVGVVESLAWLGAIVASILFSRHVLRHAAPICAFLIAAQSLALGLERVRDPSLWTSHIQLGEHRDFFRFSGERNVLVIVLDAFESTAFDQWLEEDPSLSPRLDGFHFFPENLAAFSTTLMSIPAMLTGKLYRNDETQNHFLRRELGGASLPALLSDNGFETQLITKRRYCDHISDGQCSGLLSVAANHPREIVARERLRLRNATAFRHLPYLAKRALFHEQDGWLAPGVEANAESRFSPGQQASVAIAQIFDERATADAERPTFKFVHYMLPHKPLLADRSCSEISEDVLDSLKEETRYFEQAGCALDLTLRLLDTLRSLDVYDKTLIIVTADHGLGGRKDFAEVAGMHAARDRAMPLMLAKPLGSRGQLRKLSNPTHTADIPKTVATLLEIPNAFPGESIFDAKEPRRRSYFHYVWHNRFWWEKTLPPIQEFIVEGPVEQQASWGLGESLAGPSSTQ